MREPRSAALALLTLAALGPAQAQDEAPPAAAAQPASAAASAAQRVVVRAPRATSEVATPARLDAAGLARGRAGTSDTARLLKDLPGVSLAGAGGVSSLPALNGLGGDRVRTLVDGMELLAACPNHMNSPLSYMDPAQVGSVRVYAGIAPVSVGGDSLGGTVQVEPAAPEFAHGDDWLGRAQATAFARGAGHARGGSVSAGLANGFANLSVNAATTRRDNLRAARDFKPVAPGSETGPVIAGDVIASSAYRTHNDDVALALRHEGHLLQIRLGRQDIGFEGFPNQRMDMTSNRSTQLSLRYTGRFDWGELVARAYRQKVDHRMDMGPDRFFYGFGMPMDTEAVTRGAALQATRHFGEADGLRVGVEGQTYLLYDWWPAVGGSMGPNAFWNVDQGQRRKAGAYAEWDSRVDERWSTQLGLRADRVLTDAGAVQGYDNGLGAIWGNEAAAFNARERRRGDTLADAVALARYAPAPGARYEFGLARKSRAPGVYQRYPWSTQPMAALMNNFLGDGNGYIGQPDLRPEVAHTVVLSGHWLDTAHERWSLKAGATLTRVQDYIDARRCDFGQCGTDNLSTTQGFVLLQYANQSARLLALDLSGQWTFAETEGHGAFTASAVLKATQGRNRSTGDHLYNIMPPNATLGLEQRHGAWSAGVELVAVAAKSRVSAVRNEMRTPGYALVNLRASYEWAALKLEFGVDNAFNRFHAPPLGGAYLGQGRSMTSAGIPWGVTVPGPARSLYGSIQLTL